VLTTVESFVLLDAEDRIVLKGGADISEHFWQAESPLCSALEVVLSLVLSVGEAGEVKIETAGVNVDMVVVVGDDDEDNDDDVVVFLGLFLVAFFPAFSLKKIADLFLQLKKPVELLVLEVL